MSAINITNIFKSAEKVERGGGTVLAPLSVKIYQEGKKGKLAITPDGSLKAGAKVLLKVFKSKDTSGVLFKLDPNGNRVLSPKENSNVLTLSLNQQAFRAVAPLVEKTGRRSVKVHKLVKQGDVYALMYEAKAKTEAKH